MESRKRPLLDTEDSVVTKKRILTGTNGSPLVNGSAKDDENEDFRDRLEVLSFCLLPIVNYIYMLKTRPTERKLYFGG